MTYYNEQGAIIPESEIDLSKGYLVDKTVIHHEAVTHQGSKVIPGAVLTFPVVDKPAWSEVTEQTYVLYKPDRMDKVEAQVLFTAVMTDTVLEV